MNLDQKEKIELMLEEVQKRAKVRKMSYQELIEYIQKIEKKLSSVLYKKDWRGIQVRICQDAGKLPTSYKYTPYSTCVTVRRGASSWLVEKIERGITTRNTFKIYGLKEKTEKVIAFISSKF